MNVTLFETSVFADEIEDLNQLGIHKQVPNQTISILIRHGRERDTKKCREPGREGSRDCSDVAMSQGMPATTRAREGKRQIPPCNLCREYSSADTSISDLWPPELCVNKFLLL